MPKYPNEGDFKEGENLMGYFQKHFAEVLERYEKNREMPILSYTMFGGPSGNMHVHINATSNIEIYKTFNLASLAQKLYEATGKWETESPELEVAEAGVEYDAIKQLIKNGESGEDETE